MAKSDNKKQLVFAILEWMFLLSPFLWGGFFPWGSAVFNLVLITLLFLLSRDSDLCISKTPLALTAVSIVLFHLLGIIWGTDHGMALVGAVQFLPLPLFVLLLDQYHPQQRQLLLRKLPYVACAMVIISFVLSKVILLEGWFLVNKRQAGFFQYPNTYAAYLLFAVVLVLFGPPLRFGQIPWLAVLVTGIVLTGSRTVFLLLLPVFIAYLVWEKDKGKRLRSITLGISILSLILLYVTLTGDRRTIGRFLTVSLTSHEFLGRILYAYDVIPVILKHPFGLGYTGYRWLQGSFQTGLYSVQHVHNELLQLMADVGWIPAGLFIWALCRSFRSNEGGICRKILILVLLLHSLLDFDTQFVSVAMLLFLALDTEPKASRLLNARPILSIGFIVPIILSTWIGTASFFHYLNHPQTAVRIYPGYTTALVSLLPTASQQEMQTLSTRILRLNNSVAIAHDARARTEFSSQRISGMLEHKQKAIYLAKYNINEYIDYFDLLRYSYELYAKQGDLSSAEKCLSYLQEIPRMLETVKEKTSVLGRMIPDQAILDLPDDYMRWLQLNTASLAGLNA